MNLYSSQFSEYNFESTHRILFMSWKKDSQNLDEEKIKAEMNRSLSFIEQYGVRNVIVDTRNYTFRNNLNIQNWITRSYMPLMMSAGLLKYAIIVDSGIIHQFKDSGEDDEKVLPIVEYFAEMDEAKKWIESHEH